MTHTCMEINDAAVKVLQNNTIVLRSPGYAVVNHNRMYLGSEALSLSRSNPRMTYTHFWNNLNQEPLAPPSKLARHHADLAYAHLAHIHEHVGKPGEVLFAVPGHYNEAQLSLLLGLAEAIPFRATGLVDAAVAVAAATAETGTYYYLEIYLHHLTTTRLHADREVARSDTEVNDAVGLIGIHAKFADYIADRFIEQSRFDPLHNAETEQALYDRLPDSLAALCTRPEITFELPFESTRYRVTLKRQQLLPILQPLYSSITQALEPGIRCLVSHSLAQLPGFTDLLDRPVVVSEDAVFRGCQKNLSWISSDGDAVDFITHLPVAGTQTRNETPLILAPAATTGAAPSHVLCSGKARALGQHPLYLSATGDISRTKTGHAHCAVDKSDAGVIVQAESELVLFKNGAQIHAAVTVEPGDMITFAGSKTEYIFIEIVE